MLLLDGVLDVVVFFATPDSDGLPTLVVLDRVDRLLRGVGTTGSSTDSFSLLGSVLFFRLEDRLRFVGTLSVPVGRSSFELCVMVCTSDFSSVDGLDSGVDAGDAGVDTGSTSEDSLDDTEKETLSTGLETFDLDDRRVLR